MSYVLWCLVLACAAAQPVETSTEATTHLYVRTTPSGAQILLDGKELGTSPGVFPVKPGQRRRLVIELDGQVAKEQQITIRDGRITRIELTLIPPEPAGTAAPLAETGPAKKPRPAADKPLSFGPVVERVVNDDDPKLGDFLIGFDTGQVHSPPVEQMKRAQQALEQWVVEAGVDAVGETKTSVRGLMGVDMIVVPIASGRWDRISPNDVAEAVALGKPGRPIPISGKGDLPATFIFQTREGGMGVLQIFDFVEKPRGVKIRYKPVERRERKEDIVILTFEIDREPTPGDEPVDVEDLLTAISRRLDRGWVGRARVGRIGNQRVEVVVSTTDPEQVRRIERLVQSPGTIEFRILANDRDHKALIERALKEDDRRVLNPDGTLAAWWVPVAPGQEQSSWKQQEVATRTIQEDGRQTLEVLVVADPFDVTDAYLVEATSTADSRGKPSVGFTFDSRGGQLLGGLTGANLPDKSDGFSRQLGIILNGQLHSAPAVRSTIRERGEITGDFTREEVEDLTNVLNAGALPMPLEKVSELRASQ